MLFTQLEFFFFFAGVFTLYLFIKNATARKILFLVSSYYFYAYWDWRFLSLILISTGIDFIASRNIARTFSPTRKKFFLWMSIVSNLGILGFFKYYNFFIDSFVSAFPLLGNTVSTMHIILPIGISFYTFQTLSYTIDVYKGTLKPRNSFLEFAVFVAFFPQLVAGPIVRAKEFLPQIQKLKNPTWRNIRSGLELFVVGLFKKVIMADRIAQFVDTVFESYEHLNTLTICCGILAYGIQIYCDFSGYSDMAIGVARTFNIRFQKNFNLPYCALSPADFWRRWHISLSTWLRDYLYIPLGGNRGSKPFLARNLMLTMTLGGLWHGANWTFILWGVWHGQHPFSDFKKYKCLSPSL